MAFDELLAHLELTLGATASLLHDLIRVDRTFSTIDPAAPSDEAPAVRLVALTSFASRPIKARLRSLKVRSQVRAVISTLLVLQTIESAVTEILVLGGKPKFVPTAEKSSDYSLIKSTYQRGMLGYHSS